VNQCNSFHKIFHFLEPFFACPGRLVNEYWTNRRWDLIYSDCFTGTPDRMSEFIQSHAWLSKIKWDGFIWHPNLTGCCVADLLSAVRSCLLPLNRSQRTTRENSTAPNSECWNLLSPLKKSHVKLSLSITTHGQVTPSFRSPLQFDMDDRSWMIFIVTCFLSIESLSSQLFNRVSRVFSQKPSVSKPGNCISGKRSRNVSLCFNCWMSIVCLVCLHAILVGSHFLWYWRVRNPAQKSESEKRNAFCEMKLQIRALIHSWPLPSTPSCQVVNQFKLVYSSPLPWITPARSRGESETPD
jgi:hypothetical protein